ncbi:MAG: hypothetical protein A2W08_09055 [Candidatus Rokubacteria bacterium RBG_16_73_20]|nr:MAG: hypothetical protein A2050_08705 [Candidatus Rokubacteria bacterium GWA2_73_35]OGK97989.1 MAG: hypothetical protein A2W08_09055 [Candidatus Rokubacteria bacterium RBG_16_73_20]HBH03253.1 hypothetical protein [Candidatus Rokubacteria bacterium]
MSLEQLLLLTALLLVFSFLVRLARRHLAAATRPGVEPKRPVTRARPGAVTTPVVRAPREARPVRQPPLPAAMAPALAPRRPPRLPLLRRREARRGFVLMTVLGPCRGLGDP